MTARLSGARNGLRPEHHLAGRAVLQDSARDALGLFLVLRLASEGRVADGTERNRVAWIR